MKREDNCCCFCLSSSSKGTTVDSDTLDLLKFITSDVNIPALKNSIACDDCLSKILAASDYKTRNSSKILMETNIDSDKSIMCQMCDKIFKQEEVFPLVNCVTQIDWSHFVNYLFVDPDIKSLENSHLCNSCRVSVSKIQDFLKLLHIYDRSKMKRDTNYCDDSYAKNKNLVEVKEELENLIEDDDIKINFNHNADDGNINYEDFKCKNEELDLKMEHDNNDSDAQSSHLCDKVDVKEIVSSDESNMNDYSNEEEEQEVTFQGINSLVKIESDNCPKCHCDKLTHEVIKCKMCQTSGTEVPNQVFTCTYCSKIFISQSFLDNHLLKIHNSDNVANKIYKSSECSSSIKKDEMLHHNTKDNSRVFECQLCTYKAYKKSNFIAHMKRHSIIRDFKCTLCPKEFTNKTSLNKHLSKNHKLYECDHCSYATTVKKEIFQHNKKHGIKDNFVFKCEQCTYKSHRRWHLNAHIKTYHNGDFKCTLCPKEFTHKASLDNHLLKIHNLRDVTSKMYKCDKCGYATTVRREILQHNRKHGIKDNSRIFKCQQCTFETYNKSHFNVHVKSHNNIRDFKCTVCSKEFSHKQSLDNHLLKIHNCRDNITSKVYDCDKCNYATTQKVLLVHHNIKHGIKDNLQNFKCHLCSYETYQKRLFDKHVERHSNIRNFQCTLCLKKLSSKKILHNHLLKIHNNCSSDIPRS